MDKYLKAPRHAGKQKHAIGRKWRKHLHLFFFQANLVVQEARLKVAAAELNSAQAQLDDKQRELDKVQAMYDAAVREKQVTTASTNVYFKIFF